MVGTFKLGLVVTCQVNGSSPFNVPDMFPPVSRGPRPQCQAFVPLDVVKTVAAFLEFCYIARRNIITDDSLEQLKIALQSIHDSRHIFLGAVRTGDGISEFSLPQQHSMVHYYDHIKNFGSPNGC